MCFKLKVESVNARASQMLDLWLSKGPRWELSGCLDISMFSKPSVQGVPLSWKSWHHPNVHTSWPLSRILHYYRCTCSRVGFREAVKTLYTKLCRHDPGHPSLVLLKTVLSTGKPCGDGKASRKQQNQVLKCSRLVIPFHPGIVRMGSRLAAVHNEFIALGWPNLVPLVAWAKGGRSIQTLLQADTSRKLGVRAE